MLTVSYLSSDSSTALPRLFNHQISNLPSCTGCFFRSAFDGRRNAFYCGHRQCRRPQPAGAAPPCFAELRGCGDERARPASSPTSLVPDNRYSEGNEGSSSRLGSCPDNSNLGSGRLIPLPSPTADQSYRPGPGRVTNFWRSRENLVSLVSVKRAVFTSLPDAAGRPHQAPSAAPSHREAAAILR